MSIPGETRVIKLFSPVTLEGGAVLDEVTMREPLVRDRIAHAKDRGNEEEKEARSALQPQRTGYLATDSGGLCTTAGHI